MIRRAVLCAGRLSTKTRIIQSSRLHIVPNAVCKPQSTLHRGFCTVSNEPKVPKTITAAEFREWYPQFCDTVKSQYEELAVKGTQEPLPQDLVLDLVYAGLVMGHEAIKESHVRWRPLRLRFLQKLETYEDIIVNCIERSDIPHPEAVILLTYNILLFAVKLIAQELGIDWQHVVRSINHYFENEPTFEEEYNQVMSSNPSERENSGAGGVIQESQMLDILKKMVKIAEEFNYKPRNRELAEVILERYIDDMLLLQHKYDTQQFVKASFTQSPLIKAELVKLMSVKRSKLL